jgi:hypothetical protein
MLVVAIAAVFGAALGLFMRNALLALVAALVGSGSIQLAAIFIARTIANRPDQADLAGLIESYAGDGLKAMLPTLAAAGFGAVIAAAMMAMSLKGRGGDFWLPDLRGGGSAKGRRHKIRYAQAIEEKPNHIVAESRIDRLLKQ